VSASQPRGDSFCPPLILSGLFAKIAQVRINVTFRPIKPPAQLHGLGQSASFKVKVD